MRLVVKQADEVISEFQFAVGPVHVGRHADSQIFLPDRTISRHHAVIFSTQDNKWMLEDLDSPNKTYLNEKPVHKSEIKTGDSIRIADFNIEVNLEPRSGEAPVNMQDTLAKTSHGLEDTFTAHPKDQQVIVRRIDTDHAPDIRLPVKRAKDFIQATEAICRADGLDKVLQVLLKVAAKQFNASHVWCALRNLSNGPMICHAGKRRNGAAIDMDEIKLGEHIMHAVEKNQFLLMPRLSPDIRETQKLQSAMIVPISGLAGCFGVLYLDNDMAHEHYTLSDLDYLMFLAIHTSVIIENF